MEAGLPPGVPFVHAARDVVHGETLEVVAQLGVELPIEMLAMPDAPPPIHSAPPSAVRRICRIASASRAQFAVSSVSCVFPFGVSR